MKERRDSPRVSKQLSIKISSGDFDILTETKNISASGAYFPVSKPLSLMTKLEVVLLIPLKKNKSKVIRKVNCSGIVVRVEPIKDNGKYPYRVAMYFSSLKEPDKRVLRSYVNSTLKDQ
jgi:hypothetical protein|tara:strand:- start:3071 stop:3427 length:357 start_codon:yes stop_codon:yes gene_type:complete